MRTWPCLWPCQKTEQFSSRKRLLQVNCLKHRTGTKVVLFIFPNILTLSFKANVVEKYIIIIFARHLLIVKPVLTIISYSWRWHIPLSGASKHRFILMLLLLCWPPSRSSAIAVQDNRHLTAVQTFCKIGLLIFERRWAIRRHLLLLFSVPSRNMGIW